VSPVDRFEVPGVCGTDRPEVSLKQAGATRNATFSRTCTPRTTSAPTVRPRRRNLFELFPAALGILHLQDRVQNADSD
jgi:hypothetical protein